MRESRAAALVKNPDGAVSPLAVMALTAAGLVAVIPGSAGVAPVVARGDLAKLSPPGHPALPFSRPPRADPQISGSFAKAIITARDRAAAEVAATDLLAPATLPALRAVRHVPAGLVQVLTPAERPTVPLLASAQRETVTAPALTPAIPTTAPLLPSRLATDSPRPIIQPPIAEEKSEVSLVQSAPAQIESLGTARQDIRLSPAVETETDTSARFASAFPAAQEPAAAQAQHQTGPADRMAPPWAQLPRLASFSDRQLERTRVTISAVRLPRIEVQALAKVGLSIDGAGNKEGELTDRRSPASGRNRLTNAAPGKGDGMASARRRGEATQTAAFVAASGRTGAEPASGKMSGRSSRSMTETVGQSAVSEYRMTSRGVEFSTVARTQGAGSGRVRLLIADDENIMVRLSDVLGLVRTLLPQGEFDRLAGSAQASQFISLNDLRAAGIPVRFQKNDELEIGAF